MADYLIGTKGRKAIRAKHKVGVLAKGTSKITAPGKYYRNNFTRILNQGSLDKTFKFHNIMRIASDNPSV